MKRWLCYALLLCAVAAWGGMPFRGTDVAELQPVELIRVSETPSGVLVAADTGEMGIGKDLADAFADLKRTVDGHIFLETAEYVLLTPGAVSLLPELTGYLRPACNICLEQGEADLEDAAAFLAAHEPGMTLQDYRAGLTGLPVLTTDQGRMHLDG